MAKKAAKKAVAKPGPALARPGDPLIMPDGSQHQPIKHKAAFEKEKADFKLDAHTFRGKSQKNLRDLAAPVNMFNAIAAVLGYSIMGVGDREVADALKCTTTELEAIRQHPAYNELFDTFYHAVISADSDSLTGRIASYSHSALDTVAVLSKNAENEAVKLRASTDILDRAGVTPKLNEMKGMMKNDTLRIQVTRPGRDGEIGVTVEID